MNFIINFTPKLNTPINISNDLPITIKVITIAILVWLVVREIRCWYWKINAILAEQQKQTEILEKILSKMKPDNIQEGEIQRHTAEDTKAENCYTSDT